VLPSTARRVVGLVVPEPAGTRALLLHGEPLAAHALAALAGAGVRGRLAGPGAPDAGIPMVDLCAGADLVVVHDARCPLLPAGALADCLAAAGPGVAVLGTRPVTDTVKRVEAGVLGATVDRTGLAALAAPVVLGTDLLTAIAARLPTPADLVSLSLLVAALAGRCRLQALEVPSAGRRVHDADDLALLQCLDDLGG
jgi:2-C-methyl-D-erythritol 4-phosphate cytidylyltransferase